MKRLLCISLAALFLAGISQSYGAGGADYGRGAETDPIAMASGAIGSTQIADGAVSNVDLAANAVTSTKISDGTVSNADLAADCVTSAKISDGSVSNADLAAGIDASKLTGNISEDRLTNAWNNIIQTGTCTNGQTISFTPAFTTTPISAGATWVGAPVATNADGESGSIYIDSVSASSFVLQSTVQQTNLIHWAFIQVP